MAIATTSSPVSAAVLRMSVPKCEERSSPRRSADQLNGTLASSYVQKTDTITNATHAVSADTATNASTLGGKAASGFAQVDWSGHVDLGAGRTVVTYTPVGGPAVSISTNGVYCGATSSSFTGSAGGYTAIKSLCQTAATDSFATARRTAAVESARPAPCTRSLTALRFPQRQFPPVAARSGRGIAAEVCTAGFTSGGRKSPVGESSGDPVPPRVLRLV